MRNRLYSYVLLAIVLFTATACNDNKKATTSELNSKNLTVKNTTLVDSVQDVPSSNASKTAPVKMKIIQKLNYGWARDGSNYEFILSIPDNWDDPGNFTELKISRNGKLVYSLTDQSGLVEYQNELGSKSIQSLPNLLPSTYLFMTPSKEKSALPVLFVFGWAYGSSPGSLRVIALNNDGVPKDVFYRENYMLTEFTDLNNDSKMDLIGKECFSQEWGPGLLTYDPYTVFRFGEDISSPMKMDLVLTEAYNKKEYYGWAGPKCREDVAVVMHPLNSGKPIIMDSKAAEAMFTNK